MGAGCDALDPERPVDTRRRRRRRRVVVQSREHLDGDPAERAAVRCGHRTGDGPDGRVQHDVDVVEGALIRDGHRRCARGGGRRRVPPALVVRGVERRHDVVAVEHVVEPERAIDCHRCRPLGAGVPRRECHLADRPCQREARPGRWCPRSTRRGTRAGGSSSAPSTMVA